MGEALRGAGRRPPWARSLISIQTGVNGEIQWCWDEPGENWWLALERKGFQWREKEEMAER